MNSVAEVKASDSARRSLQATAAAAPPLIVHIIYRFAIGGLENSLVNLINLMPAERYSHAVICLTDSTEYSKRIRRPDVPIFELQKREGQDPLAYFRLWRLLRQLRPAICHTRTMATLEGQLCATLAKVPGRVHGEHSQSLYQSRQRRWRHSVIRRIVGCFVSEYAAVNNDLATWLLEHGGAANKRVTRLYNGVDTERFRPSANRRGVLPDWKVPDDAVVIGTVGRMQEVKDQATLARAFIQLVEAVPDGRKRLRLIMVGDGPLRREVEQILRAANMTELAWVPGARADTPEILRALDAFVLPSRSEGTSNTILEAMASGLPIVATRVGGNPELVIDGCTGLLTPVGDWREMSSVLRRYVEDPALRAKHGRAGRELAVKNFSLNVMIDGYTSLYDSVLQHATK